MDKLNLQEYYDELLSKRRINLKLVKNCLSSMLLYFSKMKGFLELNNKAFKNPEFFYNWPHKGIISVMVHEAGSNPDKSQILSFTPYSVEIEGMPTYKYESVKLNKLYFELIDYKDEDFIKDYIDFIIASHPNASPYSLATSMVQKLSLVQRFPFNVYEYAMGGYKTDTLNSDLGLLDIERAGKLRAYTKDISDIIKEVEAEGLTTPDAQIKMFSDRFAEKVKKYEDDELSKSKLEVFFGAND